jgi:hypothetical protein
MAVENAQIEELLRVYDAATNELASEMAELATAEPRSREALFLVVLAILARLRADTRAWLDETVLAVYGEAVRTVVEDLADAGLPTVLEVGYLQDEDLAAVTAEFQGHLEDALGSIQALAGQLRRGGGLVGVVDKGLADRVASGVLGGAELAAIRTQIREQLHDQVVRIVGGDGKTYGFDLRSYGEMLASRAYFAAISLGVVSALMANGQDLVQVSPNPSTIGDYCDEYRGKVFSLSGTHPDYPPAASLPGGTCPMHPRCHHVLMPYLGGENRGTVDETFLAMDPDQEPWMFQRAWEAKLGRRA